MFKKKNRNREIAPDEIMLDSSNMPGFDKFQFEGRLERPISKLILYMIGVSFLLLLIVFLGQSWHLQVVKGEEYKNRSEKNLLRPIPIFAGRGVIYDRNDSLLAWNSPISINPPDVYTDIEDDKTKTFNDEIVARREYATSSGLSHILGYIKYPSKDKNGFYYREDFEGVSGTELYFNDRLRGQNGSRLIEVDASNNIISHNIVRPPVQGENLYLSIDSRVQSALYKNIKDIADRVGFHGGSGIIMDIHSGEVIAMTNYPEFNSQIMSDGDNPALIRSSLNDPSMPFLNRAIDGLYTPGSIMKPYIALGALNEDVIEDTTVIVTTGSITIPNPYDSTKSTIFRDWKNHGPVNMRQAISVSSDAYFYTIGGGYKDQKGMGILKIDDYLKLFGFGNHIPESFFRSKSGTIPTPEWKKATFNEDWYLGNTYHTAIGQYGFQVTPIQVVRAMSALANGGLMLVPSIIRDTPVEVEYHIDNLSFRDMRVIHEGMRLAVLEGTGKALNVDYVDIAAKSGTAELGVAKDNVNSWITGFWPYENPRYAFAVMLEKGSVHNLIGAAAATRQTIDWMNVNTPEYFR